MPGRTPEEAWRDFRGTLRKVVGCIDAQARLKERLEPDGTRWIGTDPNAPVRLGGAHRLATKLHLRYLQLDNGLWRMTTTRYAHAISPARDLAEELMRWEWHPTSKRSPVGYAHFHIVKGAPYGKKHIPTGRVSVEDILMFAVAELGAEYAYPTAGDVLAEIRDLHKKYRAWG